MKRFVTLLAPAALVAAMFNISALQADPVAATSEPRLASETMASMDSCGQRNSIVEKLSAQFKEAPQAVGVVDKSAVLEVFVSEAGTWTIIATGTDGNSCILSAGDGWQTTDFKPGVGA